MRTIIKEGSAVVRPAIPVFTGLSPHGLKRPPAPWLSWAAQLGLAIVLVVLALS